MPKKIITSEQRLQTYSKPLLIELILELRDRFNDYQANVTKLKKQVEQLHYALVKAKAELTESRKKARQLMKKGGQS